MAASIQATIKARLRLCRLFILRCSSDARFESKNCGTEKSFEGRNLGRDPCDSIGQRRRGTVCGWDEKLEETKSKKSLQASPDAKGGDVNLRTLLAAINGSQQLLKESRLYTWGDWEGWVVFAFRFMCFILVAIGILLAPHILPRILAVATNSTLHFDRNSLAPGIWPTTERGPAPICLQWDGKLFEVLEMDEYVFEVRSTELAERFDPDAAPETLEGLIVSRVVGVSIEDTIIDETIQIQFRPRGVEGNQVRVGFFDLSIRGREQLAGVKNRLKGSDKDELHALSYDDLARGGASSSVGSSTSKAARAAAPKAGTFKKIIAMFILAASMLAVVGWVIYMVQSRSTVAVSNSVMMGNYMPVNSPQQAQLTEILVEAGQVVHRGDAVARLSNDLAETELALVESKLQRAQSELQAYQEEAKQLSETFKFTEMKVVRDLKVAEAEMNSSEAQLSAAKAQLARLQPLIAKGNVAMAEVDEANAIVATAEAEKLRQAAVIETLRFAEEAAQSKILVNEDGASNPMGELKTKVALAEAACKEFSQCRTVLHKLAEPVELLSPADGTVYAIYRNEGETLKVADQMLAVSADAGGWAIGHVAAYLAPEIRPGHPVEIEFPSLGITATGTVEGIGHRAVYERGGYNADFRGGPLEVPIRVAIDLDGQAIPSGMRLNMTVRVKDHLKDLKNWVNEKIATYWDEEESGKDVKVAMTK